MAYGIAANLLLACRSWLLLLTYRSIFFYL